MNRTLLPRLLACLLAALALPAAAAGDASLDQAIATLTERLEGSPRNASLLNDYANLLTRAERYDEALEAYRSALELDPDSLTVLYNLGLLELEFGRIRPAGRFFKRAVELDDDFARGHYGLGMVLAERGRHHRAVKHFSRALILEPDLLDFKSNPEILFNRLATWASMRAYLSASPQRGTRLYSDPVPIVGLLLPELDLTMPEETGGEDEADEGSEAAEGEAGDG